MRSDSIRRWLVGGMALMIVAIAATRTVAQSPDPRNAATWYQRAIEQYDQIPEATRDLINNYDWTLPPSPELRAAVANVQSVIQTMQRGAALEHSDFNLDRAQGVELMLPHLNKLRSIARLTRADVSIRIADGDFNNAADRLSSLYRMSGHGGDDGVIISSLVGQAVFNLVDGLVQSGVDQGAFDAGTAAKLLGAVEVLGTNDPFSYVEAIAGEQEMMVGWLEAKFNDPEERTKLGGMFYVDPADPNADLFSGLSSEEFQTALDQYDDVMTRMVEVFSNPDPEAAKSQLAEMSAEIESGQLGPMVQVLMPALEKCYETKLKGEAAVASRIEMLRKLAAGEAKPEAFANAAVWYLRAIELLEKTEDPLVTTEALHALRVFAANPAGPLGDEVLSTLAKLQPVIDLLRDGADKERCDFKFAGHAMPWLRRSPLMSSYGAGMHDCLRLLQLDAMRTTQAEKKNDTATLDRLLVCLRVERHLSGDPCYSSSLVSHHHFQRTMELVNACFEQGLVGDEFKPVLMDEVERFSRSDPFSYIASLGAAREWLRTQSSLVQWPSDADRDDIASCEGMLMNLTADQAGFLMVLADTLHRNGDEKLLAQVAAGEVPQLHFPLEVSNLDREQSWWGRLFDIYNAEAVDLNRRELPNVAAMLSHADCGIFAARGAQPLPVIAFESVGHRMREARSDLRQASVLLSSEANAAVEPKSP